MVENIFDADVRVFQNLDFVIKLCRYNIFFTEPRDLFNEDLKFIGEAVGLGACSLQTKCCRMEQFF